MAVAISLSFGPFRVDTQNECVRRGMESIKLTPKAFAVLRYLVEHPGRLVTKDELFEAVWKETVVSDIALAVCVREIRKGLVVRFRINVQVARSCQASGSMKHERLTRTSFVKWTTKQSSSPQSLKPSSPPATESPATSHPPQTAPTTTSDSSAAPAPEPAPQAASPGAETSAGNAPSASEPSAELTLRKRSRTTSPNYGLRKKQSTSKNTLRITSVGRSRTLRIATLETRLSLSLRW